MSKKARVNNQKPETAESGINRVTVSGYKSIRNEQSIDIKPLTILAGANNSGKSSMMQPPLLLKQTLEATYDPGPLLLNGPNVHFTSTEQLLAQLGNGKRTASFEVGVSLEPSSTSTIYFRKKEAIGFRIYQMIFEEKKGERIILHEGKRIKEIANGVAIENSKSYIVLRDRCFLEFALRTEKGDFHVPIMENFKNAIRQIIHLPGLRGNPERAFPRTAVGLMFPGTFQEYAASIIAQWQTEKRSTNLNRLGNYLEKLGLTWKVAAKAINDTQVELQVGRLPRSAKSDAADMVNIADVGFGVSQVLPVLVALLVAEPGQMVYIEEPEIHLHPRAQSEMAEILAEAAKRGVRVVIETHSQLLLLGIQTLVAEGQLSPDLVKLHWFQRRNNGNTSINSADFNEAGAFGNWPEDFAEVALEAESRYLDAAESHQLIN